MSALTRSGPRPVRHWTSVQLDPEIKNQHSPRWNSAGERCVKFRILTRKPADEIAVIEPASRVPDTRGTIAPHLIPARVPSYALKGVRNDQGWTLQHDHFCSLHRAHVGCRERECRSVRQLSCGL